MRCKRANLFFRIRKMKIKKTLFTIPRMKKNSSNIASRFLPLTAGNGSLWFGHLLLYLPTTATLKVPVELKPGCLCRLSHEEILFSFEIRPQDELSLHVTRLNNTEKLVIACHVLSSAGLCQSHVGFAADSSLTPVTPVFFVCLPF